jgi:sulfopyruvate decarboxylase TPP-binding subunit
MYAIPALLVISWRGEGGNDAPEHLLMGASWRPILDQLEDPHRVLVTKRASRRSSPGLARPWTRPAAPSP